MVAMQMVAAAQHVLCSGLPNGHLQLCKGLLGLQQHQQILQELGACRHQSPYLLNCQLHEVNMPLSLLLLHVLSVISGCTDLEGSDFVNFRGDSSSFLVKTYVFCSTQMAARACVNARLTTSAVHLGTKPAVSIRRAQAKQIMAGTAALSGQKAGLQVPKVVEGSLLEAPPDSKARTWDVSALSVSAANQQFSLPQVPVLFHHFLCPYSQRSLLAFLEKV